MPRTTDRFNDLVLDHHEQHVDEPSRVTMPLMSATTMRFDVWPLSTPPPPLSHEELAGSAPFMRVAGVYVYVGADWSVS